MTEDTKLEFCVLNVAASPHPAGVYLSLLQNAALEQVQYWGPRVATISPPVEIEPGFYQGRVATWDEIDFSEPGIAKDALDEVDVSAFSDLFPPNIGFNGRLFTYTFRERDHTLFVEVLNELGKTLSPRLAGRIFQLLFSADVQGPEAPFVEVTVVPHEDALKQILSIYRLKKLHIHLVRPNADEVEGDAEAVLRELEEQGAKSQDVLLVAAAGGDGLEPNDKTKTQASVAEFNGFVDEFGRDAHGNSVSYSTRAYPRIIERIANEFASSIQGALSVAKEAVVRRRRDPDL